jgi:hypothetical protein
LFHGHKTGIYRAADVLLLLVGAGAILLSLRLYRRLGGRLARYFDKPC